MNAPGLPLLLMETLVNRALRLDPGAPARLATLSGVVVGIRPQGLNLPLFLRFDRDGVTFLGDAPEVVDVTINGSPLGLLRVLVRDREASGFPEDISIVGDVGAAQRVRRTLRELDIDWEEALSRVVGDVAAHQLGNAARGLQRWVRRSAQTLLLDTGEYLTEEIHAVAAKSELEAFVTAVDLLRDDAARLERRVRRLREYGRGREP